MTGLPALLGAIAPYGHIVGAAGGIMAFLAHVIGGWKKWALVAAGFAALGLVIFVEHESGRVAKAELDADRAKLEQQAAELDRAGADIKSCQAINAADQVELQSILDRANRQTAAIAADADRRVRAAQQSARLEETIHGAAKDCPAGNPAPYRAVQRFLRDNPDHPAGPGSDAHPGG